MITVQERIQNTIESHPITLYMKGTADAPQCGFSAVIVQILQTLQVPFKDINVLADPEIRQGIKDYSNWPTIPQLYLQGEFLGGCDIIKEMHQNGELEEILKEKGLLLQN